jgi:hypothetical protein
VTRSLVTPGTSSTTACLLPRILFTSVDLPTLGRPTTATTGTLGISISSRYRLWWRGWGTPEYSRASRTMTSIT